MIRLTDKLYILICILFFFTGVCLSQSSNDIPAAAKGNFDFYLDHCVFEQNESEQFYCEFYLMLYADQIHGALSEAGGLKVKEIVKNLDTGEQAENNWILSLDHTQIYGDNQISVVYDQWHRNLVSGAYEIVLVITSVSTNQIAEANLRLDLSTAENYDRQISQIAFISKIETATKSDRFFRNGKKVLPNPSRRYGFFLPQLFFHYEIYRLSKWKDKPLGLVYSIFGLTDSLVDRSYKKEIVAPGSSVSVLHGLDISDLPSGLYVLQVEVQFPEIEKVLNSRRQFEILQVDHLFSQSRVYQNNTQLSEDLFVYFLTKKEYDIFIRLTPEMKTTYIVQFWKDKDPTPATQENEYLSEIQERYQRANLHYAWGATQGWRSDRGRILILYGMPAEIRQFLSEPETSPYEIWIYRTDRIYEFVFADLRSVGQFVLIHSTRENEIHNEQWRNLVQKL